MFFCTLAASWNFGCGAPYLETFGNACGAAFKVFTVLDNEPKINSCKDVGKILRGIQRNIVFENIQFQYPSRPEVKVPQRL